jgi:hypothetical protein
MNALPIRVGVLADVDPAAWSTDAVATVFRSQVHSRRNDIVLDFRTTVDADPRRHASSWHTAGTAPWPTGVQAVIVDATVDAPARSQAGVHGSVVVETNVFGDIAELCSLVAMTTDPAALDTRRRMLVHLGVLSATKGADDVSAFLHGAELFGGTLTLTDRLLIARAVGVEALTDDPQSAALASGRSGDGNGSVREFNRIVAELAGLAPSIDAHAAALQQRVVDLETELARVHGLLTAAERTIVDNLDSMAARERSLVDRLETAALRSELLDD